MFIYLTIIINMTITIYSMNAKIKTVVSYRMVGGQGRQTIKQIKEGVSCDTLFAVMNLWKITEKLSWNYINAFINNYINTFVGEGKALHLSFVVDFAVEGFEGEGITFIHDIAVTAAVFGQRYRTGIEMIISFVLDDV